MDLDTYTVTIKWTTGRTKSFEVIGRDMTLPGWVVLYQKDKGSPSGTKILYINSDTIRELSSPLFPDVEEEREEDE